MNPTTQKTKLSKRVWAGRVITAITVLFLLVDAIVKVLVMSFTIEPTVRLGYPESLILPLGIILLFCTVAYIIPRTSVLGAILLTAYLGGATATHVRIADPFFFPILVGVLVWTGLYLRDDRLRSLIPLTK